MDAKFCRPSSDDYIIIESYHTYDTLKVAEVTQVYRQIIGFCNFEDYSFDGEAISGAPSQLQYIKNFLSGGKRIATHPTDKNGLYFVYRGVRNSLRPVGNLHIEGILSRSYDLGEPMSPFIWGRDPIPEMQLWRRNDINFVMAGGNPPPTAFAIYNRSSGVLNEVRDLVERDRLLASLFRSNAH